MSRAAEQLIDNIRRLATASAADPTPDAELLERFVRRRDEGAFAALVARHGPMVLRLCRRGLGDAHMAEDCFQETFLVLAKKAGSVRRRDGLAAFLYVVATRVARKARSASLRRRAGETLGDVPADPRRDPLASLTARELLTAVDEEVARLPEIYRLPVILCCVEGRTREEAARQLGWTEGSVKGRLERGRVRLHARLVKRGLTLAAALAAIEVSRGAAEMPTSLAAIAVRAALAGQVARGAMWLKLSLILPLIIGTAIVGIGLGTPTPGARPPAAGMLSAAQETPRNAEQAPELTATDLRGDPLPPGALARLGTVRLRHAHSSNLVATFSPDGKTVVSAGDGAGKRWDTATGKLLGQFRRGQMSAVLFAPNGRWLADAGGDLLDATSGEVVRRLVPRDSPYALVALAFAPDSSLLATSAPDGKVTLWNTATGKATQQLRGHEQRVGAGAFSSEGHTLITMGLDPGRDMKVCHWDLAKGELSRSVSLPITGWRTLRLSPDGGTLAVSLGAEVSLWDTTTGERRGSLGEDAAKAYYGLAFSPDSRKLATDWYDPESGEVRICIWDVATRKLLRRFPVPPHALGFLYFSPDNRTLATSGMREPRLRLWDTMTGNPLHQQETAHDEAIQALAFTPDGKTILSGSDDGTVRVWDAGTGRGIRQLPGHAGGVTALAATPDGRAVLSAGHGAQLLLQEWQTGKELRRLILVPKEKLSTNASYGPSMSLAPDGRTAAAIIGTGGQEWFLQVRDTADGRVLTQRTDHSGKSFAAFSPDTRILATYVSTYGPVAPSNNPKAKAAEGTEVVGVQVVLEDVTTGRQLLAITLPERNGYRAAFSPDGRTLVTHDYRVRNDDNGSHVDNHALHLWELVTGQERLTIRSPKEGFQYGYEKLVFSPDGRTLAAARRDHTIQAWDVATGAELLSRSGYDAAVYCLAFRPDGKALASGHADSTTLVWDLPDATRQPRPGVALTAERLEQAWADMASADARKGGAALWEMVATPERAVPLLGSRLSPAAPAPADKLRNLLVELDSDKFERREAASKQLADLGELAEPALEEALKADPSADKRRRIERLLAAPRIVWTPEQVRAFRAVEVLERIGSVEARRSLEALAKGTPEARLTREATASLDRIARRSAASP